MRITHDVVVCVHNGVDDVRRCLESLALHWNHQEFDRLIIVDDCSNQETRNLLAEFGRRCSFLDIVQLASQHFYTKAANRGLLESSADVITLLNSDTIVTSGWGRGITRLFEEIPYLGVVGPLSNAASSQSLPFIKSSANQTAINTLPPTVTPDQFATFVNKAATGRPAPFVPLVHGFCLSIRRNVIETVGLFDETAFPNGYGEENDFCFRVEDAGFVMAIAIDTFIFHAKSKSYTSNEDRIGYMNAGMRNFAAKHGVERIKQAVQFMEVNPHLQFMRNQVLERWPEHYKIKHS